MKLLTYQKRQKCDSIQKRKIRIPCKEQQFINGNSIKFKVRHQKEKDECLMKNLPPLPIISYNSITKKRTYF
jgi:hypothetical protein